ncbi:hypothetical protein [Streptomyces sp. NPDC054961]
MHRHHVGHHIPDDQQGTRPAGRTAPAGGVTAAHVTAARPA